MNKWAKVLLIVLSIMALLIIGIYVYIEMSYNKAFSENGMINNCCSCAGKEMYDICCDCKEPSTFLEKVYYLNEINSKR